VQGAFRFIKRLWKAVHEHVSRGPAPAPASDRAALSEAQRGVRRQTHHTLAKVTDDIGRRRTFNTAIAAVMELLNTVGKAAQDTPQDRAVAQEALEVAVLCLSPVIPHVTHALWQALGHGAALIDAPWPGVDHEALQTSTVEIIVQVNGRLRARIQAPADADEATVRAAALADINVQKFVGSAPVKKVIVVPGKLVSVVV
jgi:leucyl-tRNA synthetase